MAFLGKVKPERWSRILRISDDMTRFAVSRALGEEVFDYSTTWRTNSSIIGSFIEIMVREKIRKDEMLRLCYEIFSPKWRKGLEKAVRCIDDKQRITLPKKYLGIPIGDVDLDTTPR